MKYITIIIMIFSVCFDKAYAKDTPVRAVVLSYGDSPYAEDFAANLSDVLSIGLVDVVDIKKTIIQENQNTVYFLAGKDALDQYIKLNIKTPAISIFISNITYYHTIQAAKSIWLRDREDEMNISAIYSEPNPKNQIKLINALYPNEKMIAVILSKASLFMKNKTITDVGGVKVKYYTYSKDVDINKIINGIKNKVILAIPDPLIYNHKSIRNIIVSSYRAEKAIIGFGRNTVNAGALATTYTPIKYIAKEAGDRLQDYLKNNKLSPPEHSKYYEFKVNKNVARSFGIINTEETLKMEMNSDK